MKGAAVVLRADALRLPLADESVDLIVTSPPYFALRSYRDGDEHYAGQLGSEPTPQAFLEALWAVMAECWRVLKPTGSCFINLGDKRSQRVATRMSSHQDGLFPGRPELVKDWKRDKALGLTRMPHQNTVAGSVNGHIREKSKMLLPHRFAIGCEDGLADPEGKGWIMRSDIVWQKLNGLPEGVTDRCRDSHEYLFHFTKEGRYFAAVDEVREPQVSAVQVTKNGDSVHRSIGRTKMEDSRDATRPTMAVMDAPNPLGKLPGSVWPLASEPLIISDEVKAHYDLPDHFAAFPTELVRRVILGWSPSGVCTGCGEGRRPVVAKTLEHVNHSVLKSATAELGASRAMTNVKNVARESATITGYSCSCPRGDDQRQGRSTSQGASQACTSYPPTRRAVVLDVFGGTGTTAGVARALGRIGVSVDLSHDYSRLADYLIHRSGRFAKVAQRTHRENQQTMFEVPA